MAELWWWVPARAGTVCDQCGEELRGGDRMAFRFSDSWCLCLICAKHLGVATTARASLAWRLHVARLNDNERSTA